MTTDYYPPKISYNTVSKSRKLTEFVEPKQEEIEKPLLSKRQVDDLITLFKSGDLVEPWKILHLTGLTSEQVVQYLNDLGYPVKRVVLNNEVWYRLEE